MAFKGFNSDQFVRTLLLSLVFLFLITQIIDFAAIGKSSCTYKDGATKTCTELKNQQECVESHCQWQKVEIFTPPTDWAKYVGKGFLYLLVAFAVILAWRVTLTAGGTWNKKVLMTMVLVGVSLYFLYTGVLQPMLPDAFPELAQTAYRLQAMSPQALQSILGAP